MAKNTKTNTASPREQATVDKSQGATLGMGICSFYAMLFESNSLLPPKKRLTDEMIGKRVEKEFPGRKAKTQAKDGCAMTVNEYRLKYNRGVFSRNIPPERMSFRYNYRGEIVDGFTGKHELLGEEVRDRLKLHASLRREKIKEKLAG